MFIIRLRRRKTLWTTRSSDRLSWRVSTTIQALHILELRSSLASAFTILGLPALSFANSIAAGSVVHAADVQEVRDVVR